MTTAPILDIAAIPLALRKLNQWVLWRYVPDKKDPAKLGKVPYTDVNTKARANDPRTWLTFETALARYQENPAGWGGIGFEFSADDPYVGIDIDSCLDAGGNVEPWAQSILDRVKLTYAEISPSGNGIKVWVEAAGDFTLGSGDEKAAGQIEVYSAGHYFTVTSQAIEGAPASIARVPAETIEIIIAEEQARRKARKPSKASTNGVHTSTNGKHPPLTIAQLTRILERLAPERWTGYDEWLKIGMALHDWAQGDAGRLSLAYALFDHYSAECAPDVYGETAEKWASFGKRNGDTPRRTVGTLVEWAKEDSADDSDPANPSNEPAVSERILNALHALGYHFRLNVLDDTVMVNHEPVTDVLSRKIRTELRDRQVRPLAAAEDVWTTEALANSYHPIKEYLDGLTWDGKGHIGALANRLQSSDPEIVYASGRRATVPYVYLLRWLIGAVAKVYEQGQNMMLVLAGPQDIGKSSFVRWLCHRIPEYYAEAPLVPGDLLCDLRVINTFIWEVSELDATTRKSDVAALKAFITRETVTTRKYHALYDIKKPALVSFVGTVNEGSGFLADETGSRRFLVTTLTGIDWAYTKLDVDQVWAEAVKHYRDGVTWRLLPGEMRVQQQLNQAHEVTDPIEGWLERHFIFSTYDGDEGLTTSDIIDHLRSREVPVNGDRSWETRIGSVLRRRGLQRRQVSTDDGRRARRYIGIIPR